MLPMMQAFSTMNNQALLAIVLLAIYLCAIMLWKSRRQVPYPPGPKPLPLIGNVFDIPKDSAWLTYHEWAKDLGDVIHLSAFGQHIVVLDSLDAVTDLMHKRAQIYSGKPHWPMFGDLIGWNFATSLIPYGDKWRKHRRAFHQYFHVNATKQFYNIQARHTCKFLLSLLSDPAKFREHINHWAGAAIIESTYGIKVADVDDPLIKLVNAAMQSAEEAGMPGTFLVDVIPVLKYVPSWFPGAGFQVKAKRWRGLVETATEVPFQATKTLLSDSGELPISFATLALNKLKLDAGSTKDDEDVIKHTCATSYAAGSETTASSLAVFFAAMAPHPEVLRKAQAEIQEVVGSNRLPSFADMDNLPYTMAIVKEVIRWQPVVALGLPHTVTEDDVYKGCRIPRGAIIMGNSWAILHNEKHYADPEEFRPERFMKDGRLDTAILDPAEVAFGYGRRQCPGKHFAQNGLFIAFAMTLACFDIGCAKDADGNEVPTVLRMGTGLTARPEEYGCSIIPRSDLIQGLVQQAMDGLGAT